MGKRTSFIVINLLSGLNTLELVSLKSNDKNDVDDIAHAVCEPLPPNVFDPLTRQLVDAEAFGNHLKQLFEKHRIPLSSPTQLVLPSFFTRQYTLESSFSASEARQILIAEAERSYVFKRQEPDVGWVTLPNTQLADQTLYSAYPSADIALFCGAFQDQGIPLVGIDLNYLSLLRGLVLTGAVQEAVETRRQWILMVLADNALLLAEMLGSDIQQLNESPLAASQYVGLGPDDSSTQEESAALSLQVQEDFSAFLSNITDDGLDCKTLVLINNTIRFSGDVLLDQLGFTGSVILVEQTPGTLGSLGASDPMFPCTLEAIGGVFSEKLPLLPKINLAPSSSRDWMIQGELLNQLFKGLVVTNIVVLALLGLLWVGLSGMELWKGNTLKALVAQQPNTANGGLPGGATSFADIKRKLFVKNTQQGNITANNLLVKAGALLPNTMWIDKLELKNVDLPDNKKSFEMTGGALDAEAVNTFMNQLSKALVRSDLEVAKAELATVDKSGSVVTSSPKGDEPGLGPTVAMAGGGAFSPHNESSPSQTNTSVDANNTLTYYTWLIRQKAAPKTDPATASGPLPPSGSPPLTPTNPTGGH
jgi:hypothetical protein